MSDAPTFPETGPALPDAQRIRSLKRFGLGAALIALVIAATGIAMRSNAERQLTVSGAEAAVPIVAVVRPTAGKADDTLVLPGSVEAWNSAAIYARTNGYISRWLADIGDRVAAGQPLAILDAPELDQQLAQAEADYQTTLAQQALARTTAARWEQLLSQDAVSRQEADEKVGDYKARQAVANASLANVRRLRALKDFTRLRAPFAGIVTSRSAQIGALVVAGTAASQPLFTVSDEHRVRVHVRVPQSGLSAVSPGMHARMTLPEHPGREFDLVVARSSAAIDPKSGTMLVELQTDNPDGALRPGAYAQVHFPMAAPPGSVHIPSSALIFGTDGTTVATVDANNRVAIRPIKVGRDFGKQLEIASGLTTADRVIDTPPDAIRTGDRVQVAKAAAKAGRDAD